MRPVASLLANSRALSLSRARRPPDTEMEATRALPLHETVNILDAQAELFQEIADHSLSCGGNPLFARLLAGSLTVPGQGIDTEGGRACPVHHGNLNTRNAL